MQCDHLRLQCSLVTSQRPWQSYSSEVRSCRCPHRLLAGCRHAEPWRPGPVQQPPECWHLNLCRIAAASWKETRTSGRVVARRPSAPFPGASGVADLSAAPRAANCERSLAVENIAGQRLGPSILLLRRHRTSGVKHGCSPRRCHARQGCALHVAVQGSTRNVEVFRW